MIPIIIQIQMWLIQPKVWRFVGFGSAVVGLVCYALSSSFNYLFGNWNMLKIFLYIVFSFIICLMILFAKILQYSRSLKFKAHTAFLVLTITSVYSFFFDKVVNGKPDAYSLISCIAFAIMSLSLSRQTECGFEVDLLYFFLGCFTVQLMKIKLQLFFLGAGFSYSLIILRTSFSTVDSTGDNQYLNLQDGNSVVLHMDSLQLASTNIATASDSRNSIDSQQLVISTDIGSMIKKLATYVKALQHQNSNLTQMLSEQVKKYVEEHSQLVVTDSNFMMDALKPETIKGLEETAKVMLSNGLEKEFSDVYNNCRRDCLNECLELRLFGLQKLNIEDIHSMPWKDLENHIEKWIKAFNVAVKILFPGERRLCDRIFFGYSYAADFSFMEICKGSVIQLLNFADFVAKGSLSPERLFKMLEVFETLRDLIPKFESLFCDQYGVSLRNEAITIWKRLGEAIRGIFVKLEDLIDNSPLYGAMIMDTLESNFHARSKFYDGPSLGYIFLMNNDTYIVHMTKDNELGTLLGNDWILKHALKVWHYDGGYKKTMGTIGSELVQDFFRTKTGGEDQRGMKVKGKVNVGGSKGSKVYEGDMQEIEASPSQRRESRKKDLEMRTIVISSTLQFGNEDKMPPKDGFTWIKYGKKEILGFKYPRSYYRCNEIKLYACRAKKQVQQLDENPNIYEVRYNGGHSCNMSLKLPERQPVNISKDVTQTTMPPSSISYPGWLSPAKSISSIPEAKLAPPADGGHHPIMDNVVGYLVSAIRSQQRNLINGDGAFSFSAESEGTIELLESILASMSEKYADPSLRHFFMMNNWRYLEKANKRRDINIPIFGYVWYQKNREKVQQKLELYQKSSWDKVVQFLKLDIIEPMEHNIAVDLMKEKLNLFNMHFTEICRIQCTWSVHDNDLRTGIIRSLKNILLPAYGIFIGKFQDFLKNSAYEYIEYGMFDIHDILDNLFLGNKTGRFEQTIK